MSVRRLSASVAAATIVSALLVGSVPANAVPSGAAGGASAAAVALPKPKAVSWKAIERGAVEVKWQYDDASARFAVHLGLGQFNTRGAVVLSAPAGQRSAVIDARALRSLKAPIGSGRHFNIRVQAISDRGRSGLTNNTWAMAGQPVPRQGSDAATLRVAAYNLNFTPGLSRAALAAKRPKVAKQIVASGVAVVALEESVVLRGTGDTQLRSLLSRVRSAQRASGEPASWRWVRSTRYTRPGVAAGGDGTRILYDARRVTLLSNCPDTTGRARFSTACAIKLPRVGGSVYQRWAGIARFQDRETGRKFWFVAVHPEVRKGGAFDRNRRAQLDKIVSTIDRKNTAQEPVLIGGDFNLSALRSTDLNTLNRLVSRGYADATTANRAENLRYRTFRGDKPNRATGGSGHAGRIDMIYGRGVYFESYKTVLGTASDHNLIRATVRFG